MILVVQCLNLLQFFNVMFVPEKMRLNRFTDVYIASNHELFAQVGYSRPAPFQDGDEDDFVNIPNSPTKIQQLSIGQRLHNKMVAEDRENKRKQAEYLQQQQQQQPTNGDSTPSE